MKTPLGRYPVNYTPKAFITGISGQDGSYLTEFLVGKGYEVHGLVRRHSYSENQTTRIEHLRDKLKLYYGDITDFSSLLHVFLDNNFDEVYNLASQSHVGVSFFEPVYTNQVNFIGFINLLEIIRQTQKLEKIRIYQASSSEMFGNSTDKDGFQRETTPMHPVSPYGVSKLAAYRLGVNYRRSYNMFISNGILFNHESTRRGSNFVTAKVCKSAARIYYELDDKLELGNLESNRDWGHAQDYVRIMWAILNEIDYPDDFVCATGESRSIKELCDLAFNYFSLDWKKHVISTEKFKRAEELYYLKGDASKLKSVISLDFNYNFQSMIEEMCDYWKNYYSR
ncbi:MAG: GDP-mannose 4,6-dehydratase [Bacteroidia bacterium]|nr:GDP-mannose 4,6-dehydratase [Bacteroidia bacterium]